MPVITIASSKGGAGKTTSAIILATTLARDQRVLLVDADPAKRLGSWADKAPLPKNLTVIESRGERFIHDEIDQGRETADYTIVDLEGAATRLNAFAMGEADLVIIPMGDEQPDAEGAIETLSQIVLESRAARRTIPVRILFCRTKTAVKSRLQRSINEQVRRKVGAFTHELHDRTAFSSLHSLGGTLYDLDETEVSGVRRAIMNAELVMDEVCGAMNWIKEIRAKDGDSAIKEKFNAKEA